MQETPVAFDPVKYKLTTKSQWDAAAAAWYRWGPTLENWLGEATELMLDMADVKAGSKVLDIAAGAGGQTLAAAKRLTNSGWILAVDISPKILEYCLQLTRSEGQTNVSTMSIDGETMDLPESNYDAAISRVGLIYFPDQQAALARIRKSVRKGGKFATITYSTPENNEFFSVPVSIIRRRAELPPPQPGQPGPFSLGADGVLEQVLTDAGFKDVEVRKVKAPLKLSNAAECVKFERESFGALHQMLAGLDEVEKDAAWAEVLEELSKFEKDGGFEGPCELLIGVGTK